MIKAETVMVGKQSDSTVSLRFFERGSVNKVGVQHPIELDWEAARRMVIQIQALDPENYGKARNLPRI